MTEACAGLRRPGAAALDLANVAAGRLDGFFEQGISAWDVAAGSLLITEAGGLVGNYTGESDFLHKSEFFETTGKVSKKKMGALLNALKSLGDIEGPTNIERFILPGMTQLTD